MIDILQRAREDSLSEYNHNAGRATTAESEIKGEGEILAEEDWRLLFRGSRSVKYPKGHFLLTEGEENSRIYKIYNGSCNVAKKQTSDIIPEGESVVIGSISEGETFGETSFFEGTASASVIVATEELEVGVIESHFLRILFDRYPRLAGRFYHHLTSVLSKRILAARRQKTK
jgi:CRP-like cAMP-binding protein